MQKRLPQSLGFPFRATRVAAAAGGPAPPRKAPGPCLGAGPATGAFCSALSSRCPLFNQMFLILQEAEQGANLSLISEARPLI